MGTPAMECLSRPGGAGWEMMEGGEHMLFALLPWLLWELPARAHHGNGFIKE